jgi:hypothetical protein
LKKHRGHWRCKRDDGMRLLHLLVHAFQCNFTSYRVVLKVRTHHLEILTNTLTFQNEVFLHDIGTFSPSYFINM